MEPEKDITRKIQVLHAKANALLKQDYADEQIVAELCQSGISADYARTILENVYSDISLRKEFRNVLITGVMITVMGLAINIYSYLFAERMNAGSFLLLWGIVVAGIIMIIKAIGIYRRIHR
jgi:hypothetical protein